MLARIPKLTGCVSSASDGGELLHAVRYNKCDESSGQCDFKDFEDSREDLQTRQISRNKGNSK